MPELPEVETIRRQLSRELAGEEIARVEVRRKKCFQGDSKSLVGAEITGVSRVGKYLFIYLTDGKGLAIHLKMTGRLVVGDASYEISPYTRVVLRMKSGKALYYWTTRMFGYMRVEREIGEAEAKVRKKLGPEPWKIGEKEWVGKLQKTARAIKTVILDQHLLAGVGNIYANDALALARIVPQKKANRLRPTEAKRLLAAIKKVMERGLQLGGASDNTYVDAHGKQGKYQDEFVVYGKTGGRCPACGRELCYGKVGGRGSWWCAKCQK